MEILAYTAAALIGISLGIIGGGGSILTVPVLVYLFGVNPALSTSYSLFIVGSTSLVGAIYNWRQDLVSLKTALLFGASSVATAFITRKFIIPAIPQNLFSIGHWVITQNMVTMILFAVLMLGAATAMIGGKMPQRPNKHLPGPNKQEWLKLLLLGIAIGLTTGFLGAGGGFLLIPSLVLLVGLPIKQAIGTSLVIIAANSLIGFTGDLGHFIINWAFLLKVTAIAISGIFAGGTISKKINGQKLKRGFGWFVLLMGAVIITKEFFL